MGGFCVGCDNMLKSCAYCGKTHGYNEICSKKAEYRRKYNNKNYKPIFLMPHINR